MPTYKDGTVIVAIPSEEDYVWRISSEKVPHLTLLYLGDNLSNLDKVERFIDHVVYTSLCRFSAYVDRRGELGDQSADVLFFDKRSTQNLQEIRNYLLDDPDIYNAYHSVEQYPEWTPHLTLGYPESPAKPDKRDYPKIYSVEFDRLALWTGDFEGPEFILKDNMMAEAAWSMEMGERFLEHYGIKGMRWGHRKEQAISVGQARSVGKLGLEALKARPSNKTQTSDIIRRVDKAGGVRNISDKELNVLLKRMDLESRYSKLEQQHHKERTKGRQATLKLLGEVGKIAAPIVLGGLAAHFAANNRDVFRTTATVVGQTAIKPMRKAIGS